MKTAELTGASLDWAVAKCEGLSTYIEVVEGFTPSTDWAQGGAIIEREKISTWFHSEYDCWCAAGLAWMDADVESDEFFTLPEAFRGPTVLVAAMRCYVASKLGDEVNIPEELK